MEKYIRTDSSIFEVVDENELVFRVKAKGNPNNIYSKSKSQTPVYKCSDKLENLINRYIVITTNVRNHYTVYKKREFKKFNHRTLLLDIKDGKKKVYGAIWTIWGLKYVTELKSDGSEVLL